MADSPNPAVSPAPVQDGQSTATQTPPASTPTDFKMPEKFAGKSAEDIARSYAELESQYGKASQRLGDLDRYSKIGSPDEINQVLEWSRNVKAALDRGLLVPKQESAKAPESTAQRKPWEQDDWAFKSPAEQFEALNQAVQSQNKAYIDQLASQYGQQIQQLTQQDGRQKQIMMRAIQAAIKNPDVDPEALLTETAQLASKTPEELMDLYLDLRSKTPDNIERMVNERLAARLAEEKQKLEAQQLAELTSASTPRKPNFGRSALQNRETENRAIIEALSKQGIRLI